MLLRFDATLRGVSFSGLDDTIILRDIEEEPAEEDIETAKRAIYYGTRLTKRVRRKLSIRLIYNVREYDSERRADMMDKIAEWVGDGGWLTLSTRPGKRIFVHPDVLPAQGSALRWTDDLEMVLTAYESPYFESSYYTKTIIQGNNVDGSFYVSGTLPDTLVEANITNIGDTNLEICFIACGDTTMVFSGLSIAFGDTLRIKYTDQGILTVTVNDVSVLANRSASSSDDLIAKSQQSNYISYFGNSDATVTFMARGRYL